MCIMLSRKVKYQKYVILSFMINIESSSTNLVFAGVL
jgi:hypothetical protein